MPTLVVDDRASARMILRDILKGMPNLEIFEADCLAEAQKILAGNDIEVALIDIRLDENDPQNRDGLEIVKEMAEGKRGTPIVVSVSSNMHEIRAAMRHGAFDYILKDDLCAEMILPIIKRVREQFDLKSEIEKLRERAADRHQHLIGTSRAMQEIREISKRLSTTSRPVLIRGPSGTGKELVARRIHALGRKEKGSIMAINCGAIPDTLIESHLFGHEKGAFTGALSSKEGYFSAVGNGSLFLDEIAELPLQLQPKLLRVLEDGKYLPLGSNVEQTFQGRVIAATHADLEKRVRDGLFREDLYYRLNVFEIQIPPLNLRREDIPELALHFAVQQSRKLSFTQGGLDALASADWPGNARQLRNAIDRMSILSDDSLITEKTVNKFANCANDDIGLLHTLVRSILNLKVENKLRAAETALIDVALKESNGNKSAAARLLGVHRKYIERRSAPSD